MRNVGTWGAAFLTATAVLISAAVAADDKKPERVEGYIHEVDKSAHTFVLGGKKESRTTFKVLVNNEGQREAAHVLLDGKRATFDEAIQAKRKAAVTFLRTGEELWVWKVEVTSEK